VRDHEAPGGGGELYGGYAVYGLGPYTTAGLYDGT
jgi:hypothetical protein